MPFFTFSFFTRGTAHKKKSSTVHIWKGIFSKGYVPVVEIIKKSFKSSKTINVIPVTAYTFSGVLVFLAKNPPPIPNRTAETIPMICTSPIE